MDNLFEGLNEQQIEAIKTTDGPVMAIAGAGSGKTNVLTKRIAYLIDTLGIPLNNILAITFTNKAANEMKSRIGDLLNVSTRGMWVSTFHAMCARILRRDIHQIGYDKNFQIIDDDDVTQLVKSLQRDLGISTKAADPRKVKNHVLKAKHDPSYLSNLNMPFRGYVERVFDAYQTKLKNNNLVDFEDLLVLTLKLLKTNDELRREYQRQFQYILVDEFQDTNNAQYQLIKLLSNEQQNVFIVGDEDQSIYAFRGANIENINRFTRDFEGVKTILLEENYRSTNTILKAANNVIKGNKNRIEKNLFSTKGEGDKIILYKGYSPRDEVDYVINAIKRLNKEGFEYSDIGVLYRTNAISRVFEEGFMQQRLPYRIVGNTSFFKRKEIKDIVAYLRLIVNPHDDYSFERVVNEPKRGIGAKTMEKIKIYADDRGSSLYDAIDVDDCPVSQRARPKLKAFKALIDSMVQTLDKHNFNTLIDDLLIESGYKRALEDDEKGDVRFENIQELKTMLSESESVYESDDKVTLLTYVLEDIALKSSEDDADDEDAVTLMTLHSAKGLEFRAVFLVSAEQGLFPLNRSLNDPKELEEERRLMYVGITRAKERLFVTNAKERNHYGEFVANPDSMFIREIDEALIHPEGLASKMRAQEKTYKQDASRKRKAFKPSKPSHENAITQGDKIMHKVFGKGVVVSVTADQCKIAFSKEHGIKTLMKDHPAIKKL